MTEYLSLNPQVQANCWFLDRVVNMMEEGVDVAVRIGELPDSSLQGMRMGSVRRVLVASPDHLKRHGRPQHPQGLQDQQAHAQIAALGVTPSPEWKLQKGSESLTLKLQPRMNTSSNEAALQDVRASFGITRLLSYQVASSLNEGRLERLLVGWEPPALPVHVLHREGRYASQKSRGFIDLAVARLRAHSPIHAE